MRILFYISTIRGGGAARVMVNLANGLAQRGYEICFVTNFAAEHEYELSSSIKRYSLEDTESKSNRVVKNSRRIKGLRKLIRRINPDVSIAFMRENNFRLILASKGLLTKTVVSVRNTPDKEYPSAFSKVLANLLYKRADSIIFQTESAQAAFPVYIRDKSKIIINPIDDKFFYEREGEGDYILACGRLSNQKNYPMMIQGFKGILNEYPNERLLIYGEGRLKDQIQNLINSLGVNQFIELKGYSTNMPEVYKQAKLLLVTSDYEGIPNTMLEAMASSIPVISTDCPCGGPRMIIKEGYNGYLVPVNDHVSFSEKIKLFLADDNRIKMNRAAQDTAEKFRLDAVLNEWIEVFNDIMTVQ